MTQAIQKQDGAAVMERSDTSVSLLEVIERAAKDHNTDIEKMERLMAMYERAQAKQAEAQFNESLMRCQEAMKPVAANCLNPQTRSRYANYEQLDKALRPIYTEHGFALSFDTEISEHNDVITVCHVSHKGGHTRQHKIKMPADGLGAKGNAVMTKTHAAASAISYGMRYLLKMIFNVAVGDGDDDGNKADQPKPADPTHQQPNRLDVELKKRLVDITRKIHGIEKGYGLDEPAKKKLTQWMWDEGVLSETENMNSLTGDRLAKALAKAEKVLGI